MVESAAAPLQPRVALPIPRTTRRRPPPRHLPRLETSMNPLRRLRRDRRDWTIPDAHGYGPAYGPAYGQEPGYGADPAAPWGSAPDAHPAGLPEASVYVAVPPDDLGEHRIDIALDLAAFYNTLREGSISDDHALALTQAFFPRGRWG